MRKLVSVPVLILGGVFCAAFAVGLYQILGILPTAFKVCAWIGMLGMALISAGCAIGLVNIFLGPGKPPDKSYDDC